MYQQYIYKYERRKKNGQLANVFASECVFQFNFLFSILCFVLSSIKLTHYLLMFTYKYVTRIILPIYSVVLSNDDFVFRHKITKFENWKKLKKNNDDFHIFNLNIISFLLHIRRATKSSTAKCVKLNLICRLQSAIESDKRTEINDVLSRADKAIKFRLEQQRD